ncbi:TOMM precursor leader peptide-binding protein [Actinokineospora cianjurensis]|uniref:Bacteriocin biosynthesis cyclodehydratase domain-containing protein n=1 Tax=Actinokineospora cianjurensis TaxID=585224 RepID=A0A421AWA5_9PSEU|nr:TOMM precursor leader peptide-binding protein [Actinokineospora cianjurensis]RLK54223.1 bacteriocin biosynthesis cyclodehydratase domain-containing protein [Actinokineospora cianjurensis]
MRERTLPRRPRLRPGLAVLRRRDGELQLGLDPRRALVVSGLPDQVAAAAAGLTGVRTADEVVAGVGPPHRRMLRALVRDLVEHGLVDDAAKSARVPSRLAADELTAALRPGLPSPAERSGLRVRVDGDGRLAIAVARLLAASGVGRLQVSARGSVLAQDVGTGYRAEDVGRPRVVAAQEAVSRVDHAVVLRRFTRFRPDLVVLADAVVPDPATALAMAAQGQAHLAVLVRDGVGIVGPLVVPGVSSCLHCADQHRTDLDPCWPRLATQLAGRPQSADLATTQLTAGLAVTQVLRAVSWLREPTGRPPATWNATVEVDPLTATVDHRRWLPHASCPCGAATKPTYRHLIRAREPGQTG